MPKTTALVPRTEIIIGRPNQVTAALETQKRAGRLLTHADQMRPKLLAGGKVAVEVTILAEPAPKPRRPDTTTRPILTALFFALSILAVVAGVVWIVVATISTSVLFGALVVLMLAAFAWNRAGHSGACPGNIGHCKGCRH